MSEQDDRGRIELLAAKVREIAARRRELQNEAAEKLHRYSLGLMDSIECGRYQEERQQLAKRVADASEAWSGAYRAYLTALDGYYNTYVVERLRQDPKLCRSLRPFGYGVD